MKRIGITDNGFLVELTDLDYQVFCNMHFFIEEMLATGGIVMRPVPEEKTTLQHVPHVPEARKDPQPDPVEKITLPKPVDPGPTKVAPKAEGIKADPGPAKPEKVGAQTYGEKSCEICGRSYEASSPIQRTCGEDCRREKDRRYARAYKAKKDKEAREAKKPSPPKAPEPPAVGPLDLDERKEKIKAAFDRVMQRDG